MFHLFPAGLHFPPDAPCIKNPELWFSTDRRALKRAAEACEGCSALKECREYGEDMDWGVWGGVIRDKATEKKKGELARTAADAKLALEPVSIYISRATQRLYVRRNTHKPAPDGGGEVFDTSIEVPVTIRDPARKIGTHIFTAMAKNDAGLRWSAVTIDNSDDAKGALDRISIPQEVLDRIAPTALPRSSIVISDEPLSKETNYRTEFVAVLSNQPQGGFITRKPSEIVVADQGSWGEGFGFFFNPNPQPAGPRPRGGQQYYQPQPGYEQPRPVYQPRPRGW